MTGMCPDSNSSQRRRPHPREEATQHVRRTGFPPLPLLSTVHPKHSIQGTHLNVWVIFHVIGLKEKAYLQKAHTMLSRKLQFQSKALSPGDIRNCSSLFYTKLSTLGTPSDPPRGSSALAMATGTFATHWMAVNPAGLPLSPGNLVARAAPAQGIHSFQSGSGVPWKAGRPLSSSERVPSFRAAPAQLPHGAPAGPDGTSGSQPWLHIPSLGNGKLPQGSSVGLRVDENRRLDRRLTHCLPQAIQPPPAVHDVY